MSKEKIVENLEKEMYCEMEKTKMCVKCGYERDHEFHRTKCGRGIHDMALVKAIRIVMNT